MIVNKYWTDDTQQRQQQTNDIGTERTAFKAQYHGRSSHQHKQTVITSRLEESVTETVSKRMNMWMRWMVDKWNVDCEVNEAIMNANER